MPPSPVDPRPLFAGARARPLPRKVLTVALLAFLFCGARAEDSQNTGRASQTGKNAGTLARIEGALESGDILLADSLFQREARRDADATARHRREILAARLAAANGDWRGTEKRMLDWEQSSSRRTGSGEILFWRGWAALHQGRSAEADSLFVLSSAYTDETENSRVQDALDYRFAALLDNSPALLDYLRGLPESPLPASLRAASLKQVPAQSRLYPYALWRLALLEELQGDTLQSYAILSDLAREGTSMPAKRAAAVLAFLREKSDPDGALRAYEALLVKNQQGAIAEFLRQRTQRLR